MDRRNFLAGSLAGGLAALAGCAGAGDDAGRGTSTDAATGAESTSGDGTGTTAAGATEAAVSGPVTRVAGVDLPVPQNLLSRGAGKDAIPAITEPVFADDWSGLSVEVTSRFSGEVTTKEPRLRADDRVIGVERDGEARAYPLRVLNWHEIVNDDFGGPLLVTFCPLCGSGVTAVRRVGGETATFGVSGLLWNSDLVMYDGVSGSLWSQIAGTAIRGSRTGHTLELVPSTITTLGEWRESHPDTGVLLPPPESNTVRGRDAVRDYTSNPYATYDSADRIGIGRNSFDDDRLHPKTRVLGISAGETSRAYPLEAVVNSGGVVSDTVGDTPVVVAVGSAEATLHAYERTVDGETLSVSAGEPGRFTAGGSTWRVTDGRAVDGPYEGTTLAPATDTGQLFWFAWAEFNPQTEVFGQASTGDGSGSGDGSSDTATPTDGY
ncbi:DUF3179 domain-containing protein [Halobaculum sp. MBLA0147]|uniref:DUF3179 domain-containing protein n=1 Tax=Halobaculum sp. MBLA0147 TaxID=3079934 RepID=UPI0035241449